MNRFTLAGGLVIGLIVGAFAVAAVGAQEATPTPSAAAGKAGGFFGDFKSKLAENLGISQDELDAAIDETQTEIVDEKLANGDITQERADELKDRIANGEPLFPFIGRGHHIRPIAGILDSAASVLGMDIADLLPQLRDDKSLNDIAAEQGLGTAEFKDAVLADVKAKLDEKVADGTITQEDADNMYERLANNIDDFLNNNNFEGRLPFGPHRGPRFFQDDGTDSGSEESSTAESIFF